MTERERLIELINNFDGAGSAELADHLLANDVIPLPVPLDTSALYHVVARNNSDVRLLLPNGRVSIRKQDDKIIYTYDSHWFMFEDFGEIVFEDRAQAVETKE